MSQEIDLSFAWTPLEAAQVCVSITTEKGKASGIGTIQALATGADVVDVVRGAAYCAWVIGERAQPFAIAVDLVGPDQDIYRTEGEYAGLNDFDMILRGALTVFQLAITAMMEDQEEGNE